MTEQEHLHHVYPSAYPSVRDILPDGMNISDLLSRLKLQAVEVNGGKTPLERGRWIREQFPRLSLNTIELAEEAMKGWLVLPGTGPDLYFVGNPPEWTVNPSGDHEYIFHLNRMHHWKTMCEAYSLTGELKYAEKVMDEINDWIDTVPCPSLEHITNFNKPTPWRTLEAGIRGYRTWPYVVELLTDTPYMTEAFLEKLLSCVYMHCLVLYRIAPLLWPKADHNHYLMENLGLLSFSCMFPDMKDSGIFKAHALEPLSRCMDAQCTPCGGQIEGCPSYHNGCVFWFAMRNVFSRKYHIPESEEYTAKLHLMFAHSVHATRACGGSFPWGDSHTAEMETLCLAAVSCYMAFGDREFLAVAAHFYPIASVMEEVRNNLFRMPDLKRLKEDLHWAEGHPHAPLLPLMAWQKELNQVYLRSSWDKDAVSLMTACRTPVQNAHAHMDPGGFDFTAYGFPLISDPGIYTYEDNEERYRFKRASSHNCLTINNKDPWEYKGSWEYGPQKDGRICAADETEDMSFIISRHENYAPAIATRYLALVKKRFLVVIDHVTGLEASDTVQIHYHLNRTRLICDGDRGLCSQDEGPSVELAAAAGLAGPAGLQVEDGKISTDDGVWHDSKMICFHTVPDNKGECWFAVVAVPYRVAPKTQTAYVSQTLTDHGLILDCRTDGQTFRLELQDEKLAFTMV